MVKPASTVVTQMLLDWSNGDHAALDKLMPVVYAELRRLAEVRGEFFNATNTAHFGKPNAVIGDTRAGTITTTSVPNRIIQIALRLVF